MELSLFNLATAHKFGDRYYRFLALRKRFFVDQLKWDIPHDDIVEVDQYDTPQSFYGVVSDGEEVIAGARYMPTTSQWGPHTFMLGDAAKGLLPGIPAEAVPDGIVSPDIWECSRLAFDDSMPTKQRLAALSMLTEGITTSVKDMGCKRMIALSQVGILRAFRNFGYDAEQVGPIYRDGQSQRAYAVLAMEPWKTGRGAGIRAA